MTTATARQRCLRNSSPTPTPRQQELLEIITAYQMDHGCPPTFMEMRKLLGVRSQNGVQAHLTALARKGYVRHVACGRARGWQAIHGGPLSVRRREDDMIEVVLCGVPCEMDDAEALELTKALRQVARKEGVAS